MGIIVYLTIEDNTKKQNLLVNSNGGSVTGGLSIYDMMQSVKPQIHTTALGGVASMASLILVGGRTTKRTAFPHAWRQWFFEKKEDYAFAIYKI
jgi:ATP-dependent Clp protease protease subunit